MNYMQQSDLPCLDEQEASFREIETIHYPLKVYTLGHFSLVIDGSPLNFNDESQDEALELLKSLIVFGGCNINKYKLANTLYPQVKGDRAYFAMVTDLHRMSKLIGNKDVIEIYDHKIGLNSSYWWIDIWALDRLFRKIDTTLILSDIDVSDISYLTNEVLRLYKGEFFKDDINSSWVLILRERLRYQYLSKLSLLGQFWEKRGNMEMAVDIYMRALQEDALVEEFYQRLMICYQEQGLVEEAMLVYERCSRTLNAVLGIEPSEKTKAVCDRFIN